MNKIEIVISSLIALILLYIFIPKDKIQIEKEEITSEIPSIEAWKDTHEKWDGTDGDVLKIKYIVETQNTKLWVRDMAGRIIHETPFGTERSLYQKVERRMAENHQEIADRCHAIIEQAEKQYLGKFFFTDDTGLQAMKLTHLVDEG